MPGGFLEFVGRKEGFVEGAQAKERHLAYPGEGREDHEADAFEHSQPFVQRLGQKLRLICGWG